MYKKVGLILGALAVLIPVVIKVKNVCEGRKPVQAKDYVELQKRK